MAGIPIVYLRGAAQLTNAHQMAHNARTPEKTGVDIDVSNHRSEKSLQTKSLAIFSILTSSSMAGWVEGRETRRFASVPIRQSTQPAALIDVSAAGNSTYRGAFHV